MELTPNEANQTSPNRISGLRQFLLFAVSFLVATMLYWVLLKNLPKIGIGSVIGEFVVASLVILVLFYLLHRLAFNKSTGYLSKLPEFLLVLIVGAVLVKFLPVNIALQTALLFVLLFIGLKLFVYKSPNKNAQIINQKKGLFMFLQKFTKRDLFFSIASGLITGFVAWLLLDYFDFENTLKNLGLENFRLPYFMVLVPVLWVLGVNLGYFLGQWMGFFNQFGRFAAIGFTNAAVDFGVLFLLIANTGINAGFWYVVFKTASFLVASINSFVFNKYWAFKDLTPISWSEVIKFFGISVSAIVVNVATAYVVVQFIPAIGSLTDDAWAGIGAVAGSAVALIWSFIGFKKAVFKEGDSN